jgi:hypothetical protein
MEQGLVEELRTMVGEGGGVIYEGHRREEWQGGDEVLRIEVGRVDLDGLEADRISTTHLDPLPARALFIRSADRFDWGGDTLGAAQLAVALILDATGDSILALKYLHEFKQRFMLGWGRDWRINAGQVRNFVKMCQFHELNQYHAFDREDGPDARD